VTPARALLAVLLAGCASTPPPAPSRPVARLALGCPLPDATVWIDDRLAGDCRELREPVRLSPGAHRVEVRHDDHHPRYYDVELRAGETRRLEVTLVERLP
jgi:hypothetical protein